MTANLSRYLSHFGICATFLRVTAHQYFFMRVGTSSMQILSMHKSARDTLPEHLAGCMYGMHHLCSTSGSRLERFRAVRKVNCCGAAPCFAGMPTEWCDHCLAGSSGPDRGSLTDASVMEDRWRGVSMQLAFLGVHD